MPPLFGIIISSLKQMFFLRSDYFLRWQGSPIGLARWEGWQTQQQTISVAIPSFSAICSKDKPDWV
jgi:hypothetical protein